MLFALFAIGGFALAQRVPFNPLEVIWGLCHANRGRGVG